MPTIDATAPRLPGAMQGRDVSSMPAYEIADRVCADLLNGMGPIVVCLPDPPGGASPASLLATARRVLQLAPEAAVSVAAVPYTHSVVDVVRSWLGLGLDRDRDVLRQVLERLKQHAGERPVYLMGEGFGARYIADVLRDHPELAVAVHAALDGARLLRPADR